MVLKALELVLRTVVLEIARGHKKLSGSSIDKIVLFRSELLDSFQGTKVQDICLFRSVCFVLFYCLNLSVNSDLQSMKYTCLHVFKQAFVLVLYFVVLDIQLWKLD